MIIQNKAALKRKNAKLTHRLEISRKRARESSEKVRDSVREIKHLRQRVDQLEKGLVTEWCPNCETEIELIWNVEKMGYKAFCPVCGERLMLCDECQHRGENGEYTGDCDFDYGVDSCRFNKREVNER